MIIISNILFFQIISIHVHTNLFGIINNIWAIFRTKLSKFITDSREIVCSLNWTLKVLEKDAKLVIEILLCIVQLLKEIWTRGGIQTFSKWYCSHPFLKHFNYILVEYVALTNFKKNGMRGEHVPSWLKSTFQNAVLETCILFLH